MNIHWSLAAPAPPGGDDCQPALLPPRICHQPDSECGRSAPCFDGETEARKEERGRIGRELHDSTAQSLVALELKVLYLREMSDDPQYRGKWAEVEQSIRELHQEIRAVATGCSLPAFYPDDLPAALRAMCRRLEELTGLEIVFEAWDSFDLGTTAATISLYRIAQELLANVVRHARANHVAVELKANAADLLLVVTDDGIGTCPDRVRQKRGNGLDNVRLRARALRGRLVHRRRKRGSRFTVAIPRVAFGPQPALTGV